MIKQRNRIQQGWIVSPFLLAAGMFLLIFALFPQDARAQNGRLALPSIAGVSSQVTNTLPTATPTNQPILITAIEPSQINSELGGTLSVYGNGFTPSSVIRIVGIGVLQTSYVNNEVLTGIIPPGVPTGRFNVQVGLGAQDGPNMVLEGALLIVGPTPTPVPTQTPIPTETPAFIFGQPQLAIQSVQVDPQVPLPGQPFELQLAVANLGNWTAVDIELELQSTDVAVPAAGSNVRIIPRIQYNDVTTITLPLVLSESVAGGPRNLNFNLTYFDINGRSYDTPQSIGLAVSNTTATPTPAAAQPQLLLTTYRIEPAGSLQPGDIFDLVLNLTNVGGADSSNVVVTLGGQGGEQLPPFALLNAGNIRFLPAIAAGETVEVRQTLLVVGTAVSGIYNLPIDLSYDDAQAGSQVINLLVEQPAQLQVNFYRPVDLGFVDQPLDLPIELVNIGRTPINVSTLTVTSPEMTLENNSLYIGPLDGGTAGSIDALAFPQRGGTLDVLVTINYLDDFNQPQQLEQTLTVEVEGPETPAEADSAGAPSPDETGAEEANGAAERPLFLRILMGLFGLGS